MHKTQHMQCIVSMHSSDFILVYFEVIIFPLMRKLMD